MLTLYLYYQPSDFSLLVKSRELVLFVLITECKALGMPTIQEVLNQWSLSFYCSLPLNFQHLHRDLFHTKAQVQLQILAFPSSTLACPSARHRVLLSSVSRYHKEAQISQVETLGFGLKWRHLCGSNYAGVVPILKIFRDQTDLQFVFY